MLCCAVLRHAAPYRQSAEYLQLLERLKEYADQHHRDHWVQVGAGAAVGLPTTNCCLRPPAPPPARLPARLPACVPACLPAYE